MRNLLNNRKFKNNLAKWLCMYVGVLMMLTTVITYSKYMTELNFSDNARVTKFDVEVFRSSANGSRTNAEYKLKDSYRPTETIEYYFTVKADVEVNTKISIYVSAPSVFDFMVYDAQNNIVGKSIDNSGTETGASSETETQSNEEELTRQWIELEIPAGQNSITTYKVILNYNGKIEDVHEHANYNIVNMSYTAEQVKGGN